jgi:hypothetical protein
MEGIDGTVKITATSVNIFFGVKLNTVGSV